MKKLILAVIIIISIIICINIGISNEQISSVYLYDMHEEVGITEEWETVNDEATIHELLKYYSRDGSDKDIDGFRKYMVRFQGDWFRKINTIIYENEGEYYMETCSAGKYVEIPMALFKRVKVSKPLVITYVENDISYEQLKKWYKGNSVGILDYYNNEKGVALTSKETAANVAKKTTLINNSISESISNGENPKMMIAYCRELGMYYVEYYDSGSDKIISQVILNELNGSVVAQWTRNTY